MLSVPMFEIMNKTSFSTVLSFLAAWVCFTDMASAAILIRPLNLVVRSGESIELSCRWDAASSSQDDTIEWYHTPIGSTSESKINYGHEIVNVNFKGATLNGNITGQKLKITLAQKQHAGLYTCTSMIVDKNGSMSVETAASHVVFLAADTVCQMRSNVIQAEYGVFEVCCMLSYAGSLIPAMNWRLANGNRLIERALNVTPVISENSAISTLTLVADSSLNGSRFICETVFDILSTKSNPTVANNTPGYNYTWTSSFVQVHYGPRNLRVNPAGDVFYPDDNLTCMADGNPNPEVLWLNLGTKAVARGPTVTITEEMIRDQPYLFLCRVTNPATNQNQEVTTKFTVKQRCIRSDSTVLKILLAVTLAVSAAIIATLSCYIAIGKRRMREKSRAFPIAEEKACDSINPKTPLSRVSRGGRYNLSLPLPIDKHPVFDENIDYLSPQPPPSTDYDEIPYAQQAITVQNAVYLEIAPEPSSQPTAVPLEFSRPVNEYLASADLDIGSKSTGYETLKPRE